MMLMKRVLTGAGLVALSAGLAAAAPAAVETDLNLRSGPGPQFDVIAAMPAGATVDVMGCRAGWCQVSFAGTTGFANRSYLALAGPVAAPAYAAAEVYESDDVYAGYDPAYRYGYDRDYAYSGDGYYRDGYYGTGSRSGVSVGVATGERTFGERSAVRGEVRAGATVREGTRRTSEEKAATIAGNNPMLNAGGSASTREDANVGGNRASARVRAGTSGNANASATTGAAPRASGNASATTGAAPRASASAQDDHGPNFIGPKAKDNR